MIDQETQKAISALTDRLKEQEAEIMELRNALTASRVVIKNFEGAFKILSSAPTTTDTQEGCVYFTNVGGVYGLYARINNGWRTVALT